MKSNFINIFINGSKLCIICMASAVVLSLLNTLTAGRILLNKANQEKEALLTIIEYGEPGKKEYVSQGEVKAYYKIIYNKRVVGYVLDLVGTGYGGPLKILAGYKTNGQLFAAKLMENKETPGLGKKAESKEYMNRFIGKGGTSFNPIPTTKEQLQVQRKSQIDKKIKEKLSDRGLLISIVEWFFGKSKTTDEDSITGATITFSGVSSALANGEAFVRSYFGESK